MLGWEPPLEILAMLEWVQVLMLCTCPSGGCIVQVPILGLQAVKLTPVGTKKSALIQQTFKTLAEIKLLTRETWSRGWGSSG